MPYARHRSRLIDNQQAFATTWKEKRSKEMIINKYKLLLTAVPFPVEVTVQATSLVAATKKAKKTSWVKPLRPGRVLEYEILERKEV